MLQKSELQANVFFVSEEIKKTLVCNNHTQNNCIYKEIFEYNVYNRIPEMKIKTGDIVMDIGAHIGIFSRYAALQGAEKVISFEMNPKHFACLKQNVRTRDDAFNCVIFNKNLTKFKLENGMLVNGFDLNHFFCGGLFDHLDFLKIDVMGKEKEFLKSIDVKIYNSTNKVSVKFYNLLDSDKLEIINFMNVNFFKNYFNVIIPNQPIQFLYFWK